jgi:hypothetical protein
MKALAKVTAIVIVLALVLAGCQTHVHVVGDGAQGGEVESATQWYVLWGLVELNEVSSQDMAGDAEDYTITTQYTFLDAVISYFTSIATINRRTVMVEK